MHDLTQTQLLLAAPAVLLLDMLKVPLLSWTANEAGRCGAAAAAAPLSWLPLFSTYHPLSGEHHQTHLSHAAGDLQGKHVECAVMAQEGQ
jgi:hypothetical protein